VSLPRTEAGPGGFAPLGGLEGRVALVTGGSRGIGRATVHLLAASGAKVAFSFCSDLPAAMSLENEVAERGGEARRIQADMRKKRETEGLVEETEHAWGRLDILVANAGIWPPDPVPVEEMTDSEWDEVLEVNLRGVFHLLRAALPGMKERRSGRIVLVSSTAGQRGESFHAHYAASKSALLGLVKSLAVECAPAGVLVNAVAPGWVDTDMSKDSLAGPGAAAILSTIPLRRAGRPEEIAGAIAFLASPLAGYVTGEILNVNGGSVLCG
jgi:3-oxoacyl-[acyl-carrier protein] reductase